MELWVRWEQLKGKEEWCAAGDWNFIFDHIDEIDRRFQSQLSAVKINGESKTKSEIILKIISDLKIRVGKNDIVKVSLDKRITTGQIEGAKGVVENPVKENGDILRGE